MTRKQFCKWKQKNKINKQLKTEVSNERPQWADDDKIEISIESWIQNFLAEVRDTIKERLKDRTGFSY